MSSPRSLFALTVVAAVATACASQEWHPSGFLGDDYSAFAVSEDTGNLVYRNPAADFSGYDKVFLDRVEIWVNEDTRHRDVAWPEIRRCADGFETAVVAALGDDYPLVDHPGFGTLRVRIALTGIGMDVDGYSTRENLGYGDPETVDEVARHGTNVALSEVSIEAEFLDSVTGERLVAVLARSAGGGGDGSTSWESVEPIFQEWANSIRAALDRAHQGS